MNVECHHRFIRDFPEEFPWQLVDSNLAMVVAVGIARLIEKDLRTVDRHLAPGLREALCILAKYATCI